MAKNHIIVCYVDVENVAPNDIPHYMEAVQKRLDGSVENPAHKFLEDIPKYFIPVREHETKVDIYSLETNDNTDFTSGTEISEAVKDGLLKNCKIIPEVPETFKKKTSKYNEKET